MASCNEDSKHGEINHHSPGLQENHATRGMPSLETLARNNKEHRCLLHPHANVYSLSPRNVHVNMGEEDLIPIFSRWNVG